MRRIAFFVVWVCAALWVTFAVQGVLAYLTLEPSDSGFTRGLNRVMAFFRWELYALGLAVIGFLAGRKTSFGDLTKQAARMPLWLSGGFFLAVLILFAVTVIVARVSG